MMLFRQVDELQQFLKPYTSVAFVPTMGALHAGHIALIRSAREAGHTVVCSIFVNPTQFNDPADFARYPITINADLELLTNAGCHILFLPSVNEVYPGGAGNMQAFSFGALEEVLEGAHRPGHFRGVGQVVNRLLDIVRPQHLYMGQKDYQQCLIVKSLLQQTGKSATTEMHISPTVREADGLAMSSRNRLLTEPQRALAGVIYQCLVSIKAKQNIAPFSIVEKECMELLQDKGFAPEYVSIANADNLEPMIEFSATTRTVALIAAKLGSIRLIDNMLLGD